MSTALSSRNFNVIISTSYARLETLFISFNSLEARWSFNLIFLTRLSEGFFFLYCQTLAVGEMVDCKWSNFFCFYRCLRVMFLSSNMADCYHIKDLSYLSTIGSKIIKGKTLLLKVGRYNCNNFICCVDTSWCVLCPTFAVLHWALTVKKEPTSSDLSRTVC